MYQSYRPSGRVAYFLPALVLLSLAVLVTTGSGLCVLLLKVSPGTMWDIIALAVCGGTLIELCARLCMEAGWVRNAAVAWITGILHAFVFFYFLFVFDAVFFSPGQEADIFRLDAASLKNLALRFLEVAGNPGTVIKEAAEILRRGDSIRGNTGNVLFSLQGILYYVIVGLLGAAAALFTGVCFFMQSREPFCEATRRWCRETELYFEPVGNRQNFMHRLSIGDLSVFQEMEPLQTVNANYTFGTLYYDAEGTEFYITLESRRRKEASDKNGTPRYDEEELVKHVSLDRDTGRQLLTMGKTRTVRPEAETETGKTKVRRACGLILRYFLLAVNFGIAFCVFQGMEPVAELSKSGVYLFYAFAVSLVSAVNFFGSLQKRYVVKGTETEFQRMVRQYQVEETKGPAALRTYCILMFFTGILMIAAGLKAL